MAADTPRFTREGLAKLGEIVKAARGGRSYRQFQSLTGLSHTTIRNIELYATDAVIDEDFDSPEIKEFKLSTLEDLAPHTGYTAEQLKLICQGHSVADSIDSQFLVAEDVLGFIYKLPASEVLRLAEAVLKRSILSQSQLVRLLKMVVSQIKEPFD